MLKIKINAHELAAELEKDTEYLLEKEMRGVVADAANVLRDDAIANANEIGLSRTGPTPKPSGGMHDRAGQIPSGIYAFVEPNAGGTVKAKVAFRRTRENFHAFFLEFGTRHMSPQPFFMRALSEVRGAAVSAAQKRLDEGVGRMLGG
jgi:HK97 gp10 family phage protein